MFLFIILYKMKWGYSINYSFYQKNSSQVSEWLDYLRLSLWYRLDISDTLWINIDDDNSNFAIINILDYEITIQKNRIKGLWYGYFWNISYNWISVPIFVVKYRRTKTIIDFYGSLFRLIDLWYFPKDFIDTIRTHLDISDNVSITRIDYRLDYFLKDTLTILTPEKLLNHSFSNSKGRDWKKWHKLTNRQVWDKDSKSVVFRLYDKLLDTTEKHKDILYFDYFRFPSVHRLEFECDLKFCKGYNYKDLDKLIDKVHKVFWLDNEKWIWKILYRYDKNKLVYTRLEIAKYHSWLYRNVCFLVSNYINSECKKDLNPLDILYSYINKFNWDNLKLSKDIWKEFNDLWNNFL